MFMHFHSMKVCRPKSGDGNRSKDSSRPPEAAARQFLAQLIGAQLAKCAGWGGNERRPTHLEVDHIIPWTEDGPAELATSKPCVQPVTGGRAPGPNPSYNSG